MVKILKKKLEEIYQRYLATNRNKLFSDWLDTQYNDIDNIPLMRLKIKKYFPELLPNDEDY